MKIIFDAKNLDYKKLNSKIRKFIDDNKDKATITVKNVIGQRYIGDGLKSSACIDIYGTPGNNLGAFMDGATIEVFGNGQDGIGNTMNSGKIIIHGDAGDIVGYSMRGGEVYVERNIGFRGGIHMKSYLKKVPVIVIGGCAGNFLGEYMAGGIIIILGIYRRDKQFSPYQVNSGITGSYIGTGMHGGRIYIRGDIKDYKMGKEVNKTGLDNDDIDVLNKYIGNYSKLFNFNEIKTPVSRDNFIKLVPGSHRPYEKMYSY